MKVVNWSPDSKKSVTGAEDNTIRIVILALPGTISSDPNGLFRRLESDALIPASRSSLRREADACVSIRLTGANQAPIVARGVSRSFRAHHVDAALGLESDGMFRSRAYY